MLRIKARALHMSVTALLDLLIYLVINTALVWVSEDNLNESAFHCAFQALNSGPRVW